MLQNGHRWFLVFYIFLRFFFCSSFECIDFLIFLFVMFFFLQAIQEKNWSSFCDLTIADSNEMHAVCQDTFPPCVYMTDTSHAVASLIHQYNEMKIAQGDVNHKVMNMHKCNPSILLLIRNFAILLEGMYILVAFYSHSRNQRPWYWASELPCAGEHYCNKNIKSLIYVYQSTVVSHADSCPWSFWDYKV